MRTRSIILITGLLVVLIGAGISLWWIYRPRPVAPAPLAEAPPAVAEPMASAPADPGPRHPLEPQAEAADTPLPALADADAAVQSALADLAGRQGVIAFLQLDGFVRRAVATVDNLARPHAAAQLWPVLPTPGRLQRLRAGEAELIGADNARRYAPFVAFVASVDPARAAALYRRLYPLFQQAYADLGYPRGHFNDRLVEVIDHLLAAPEPAQAPAVRLIEVKGEVPSTRPWVRYEYADPALESLSSGQKLLVRVGLAHERRLKAWLASFRRAVATVR